MKILLLTKKFPYPLREGEPIAITYLSRSLASAGCDITLLAMNTTKHFFDPAHLPAEYNYFKAIHTVTVDNRITAFGALKSLLAGEPYILSRFFSRVYEAKLREILQAEQFDVVQLETLYLAHYTSVIRRYSKAVIAMRAHNVEHEIWDRYADNSPFFLKKWYLLNQNKHLRHFEIRRLNDYDLMIAITQRDLEVFQKLGYRSPAVVAPVGINLQDYEPNFKCFEKKPSLAFIGALDWMPNQEGIVWFMENVWREISNRFPMLQFHVAGKNTPHWLRRMAKKNVHFHGEVPDAVAFLNAHSILVAPLFSGSGIKIKVLEGMALGRVVLTTPVGAEGIPAKHGEHFLLGETAEDFVKHLTICLENQVELKPMGIRARQFIQLEFDNLAIANKLIEAFKKLLAGD